MDRNRLFGGLYINFYFSFPKNQTGVCFEFFSKIIANRTTSFCHPVERTSNLDNVRLSPKQGERSREFMSSLEGNNECMFTHTDIFKLIVESLIKWYADYLLTIKIGVTEFFEL